MNSVVKIMLLYCYLAVFSNGESRLGEAGMQTLWRGFTMFIFSMKIKAGLPAAAERFCND